MLVERIQSSLWELQCLKDSFYVIQPSANGIVERRYRTLFEMVRSMLFYTNLPASFLADAIKPCHTTTGSGPNGPDQWPISFLGSARRDIRSGIAWLSPLHLRPSHRRMLMPPLLLWNVHFVCERLSRVLLDALSTQTVGLRQLGWTSSRGILLLWTVLTWPFN